MKLVSEVTLGASHEIELRPTAPFHFDGTMHKPSHFPSEDSTWEPGTLWLTRRIADDLFGLKLQNAGTVDVPLVRLMIFADHPMATDEVAVIGDGVAYDFDLYLDLAPFNALLERDELMRPVLSRWRGTRITGGSLYESLIVYIVLQNATVRRSVQMLDNLFRAYGTLLHFDGQALYSFWSPEVLDAALEEDLRALKVGYRAKSLKRISNQSARAKVDEQALRRLSNAELRRELLKFHGVGPATVSYAMPEVFHRYDALEHVSPWEQRIYSRLLFDEKLVPTERILAEVEQRWGRWKMLAAHYLFEDLFWRREHEPVPWLEELIRL